MASRSLAASRERVAQGFRNLGDDIAIFTGEFKSIYNLAIADEISKLTEIQASDLVIDADIFKIWRTVEDAARCYHSVHWWPIFREAIRGRFRMMTAVGIALTFFVTVFSYCYPAPSWPHPDAYDSLAFIVAIFGLLIIGRIIYWRVPHRYKAVSLVIATTATFITVSTSSVWSPHVHSPWDRVVSSLTMLEPKYRMQMASIHVAQNLESALWVISIIYVIGSFRRFFVWCGKALASGREFGYGRPAEECSEVIIRLLDISHSVIRPSRDPAVLSYKIGLLVSFVKGPWHQAMRSSYGPAGEWAASQAPKIELYIRHQQVKNILQSRRSLLELLNAVTSTLVNAATGDWHLIGAEEEYANKVVARRRTRIIRRAIAIGVSIAGAIAVAHFMRHYPSLYVQGIVITCIGFALVELLGILDPDAPTRLDVAGRLTNIFKRGG